MNFPQWEAYELLDAGGGEKLERFGSHVLIRPEPLAPFAKAWNNKEWLKHAHFRFVETGKNTGIWEKIQGEMPEKWTLQYKSLVLNLKLTQFKHVGIFPEQIINWNYISKHLSDNSNFLNLFGYTGAASIVARSTGAQVTHIESIKQIIAWGKENQESSGLEGVRWLQDDALKFAQKEVRRGRKYNGIILDPPPFGLGPKKERWVLEKQLPVLLKTLTSLVDRNGFILLNTYTTGLTEKKLRFLIEDLFPNNKNTILPVSRKSTSGRLLNFGVLSKIETP